MLNFSTFSKATSQNARDLSVLHFSKSFVTISANSFSVRFCSFPSPASETANNRCCCENTRNNQNRLIREPFFTLFLCFFKLYLSLLELEQFSCGTLPPHPVPVNQRNFLDRSLPDRTSSCMMGSAAFLSDNVSITLHCRPKIFLDAISLFFRGFCLSSFA